MNIASRWMFVVLLVVFITPVTLGHSALHTDSDSPQLASRTESGISPGWLEALLDRLAAWLPDRGESNDDGDTKKPDSQNSESSCGPGADPNGCP
ncbi:MAG: hypothetical protein AAF604_23360 [Acidobacteriota bacterium]